MREMSVLIRMRVDKNWKKRENNKTNKLEQLCHQIKAEIICISINIVAFKSRRQKKKFSLQELNLDRSVCMAAIWYSGMVSAVTYTCRQLLGQNKTCAIFRAVSHKLGNYFAYIYIDGQTDMAKSTQLITMIIFIYTSLYFKGLRSCYKLRAKLNMLFRI